MSVTANFRLEFINDVHARWLPVTSPNGSLCLPDSNIDSAREYSDLCSSKSLGGAARWATVSEEILKDNVISGIDTEVIRVILGDEFTGTPLFSSGIINKLNGEENKGYGAALHHIPSTYAKDDATLIMVPGNHEFDLGLDVVANYVEDAMKLGFTLLCANCNFENEGCGWDHSRAPYKSYHTIEKNGMKVGLWGMTVPYLSEVANCPVECPIKSHEEIFEEFGQFYDSHDEIVIISHMGMDEDIPFADFLGNNLPSVDKIVGIYGSHTHSIICGDDGLNRDGSDGIFDDALGSSGKSECEDLGRFDGSVMSSLDQSAYISETADGVSRYFPNYLNLESGGINIYHHAMHGLIHGSRLLQGTMTDGIASFKREDTKFRTLDSSVVLKESVLEAQVKDVNAMISLQNIHVARSDQIINGQCKIGAYGCDGGYLLAMSVAGIGSHVIVPELKGYEKYEGGMVAIMHGGSVRMDLGEGQLSLLNIYSAYPWLDTLTGVITTGENIIKNILHGTIGVGGVQLFGARMVLNEETTIQSLKAKYQREASDAGLTIGSYFCSGYYVNRMTGRNSVYEDALEDNYSLHSGASLMSASRRLKDNNDAYDIADDGLSHLEYTAKGCHPVNPSTGYSFEINTCALEHFKTVRASGEKTVDYFPPPFYNDCDCWETIIPEKEYPVLTTNFPMNGGDGYCFEDANDTEFQYNGTYDNGEAGFAAFIIDFFQTYQDNISGNRNFQIATNVEAHKTTKEAPSLRFYDRKHR